jgi:hypothetical protein
MTEAGRRDMVFSWLAQCRNEKPSGKRSPVFAKAGYQGPISEIFATPVMIIEGTGAIDGDLQAMQNVAESLIRGYASYFHGAQCVIKKDTDVTPDDIDSHSLILVGNPESNSVWKKQQPQLPVKMTSSEVLYNNDRLTGTRSFQAIVRHPNAEGKYVLMIGAGDLRYFGQAINNNIFTARYDCITTSPRRIISKLDSLHDATNTQHKAE